MREQHAEHVYARTTTGHDAPRHAVGSSYGIHPADDPRTQEGGARTRQPAAYDIYDDDVPRTTSSSRRYATPGTIHMRVTHHGTPPMKPRASQCVTQEPPRSARQFRPVALPAPRPALRRHWLVYAGLALFVMVVGWFLLNVVTTWWTTWQDDLHYGRPRTYQTDTVVGHNHDSKDHPSHFIAVNLRKQIVVYEIPAGDAPKTKVYNGPTLMGDGAELTPVTLRFVDVTGDGHIDLVIDAGSGSAVFVNDPAHDQFRPLQAGDHLTARKGGAQWTTSSM